MGAVARLESQRRQSVRVGLVVLAIASLIAAFAFTARNGLPSYAPGVDQKQVRLAFSKVGALRTGNDARIGDVRVGYVKSIDLVDQKPIVTIVLDESRPVYDNATATISERSALGEKYIDFHPGTTKAKALGATAVIPSSQTKESVELDDVLSALDAKTRAATKSTLLEAGGGLAGHGEDLSVAANAAPALLTDLGNISQALGTNDGADLTQLLQAADSLSTSLQSQEDQIAGATRDLGTTLRAVNTDDGEALGRTVRSADSAMREVKPALDALNGPLAHTESAVTALRPGAKALGRSTPNVRAFLQESPKTLEKVPGVMSAASPAVTDLTPTLKSAQPVVTQLGTTLARSRDPLAVLAPYADEVVLFFKNISSALSQGDKAGRWLRFYPVLTPESALGDLNTQLPTSSRDAYPDPGEAATHRSSSLFGKEFE
ncbi:MlaD family protein [Nocardioides sp. YJ-D4]